MTEGPNDLALRPLGASGIDVYPVGMGCAKLGAFWQGRSPNEGVRAVRAAADGGVTLFDTADCYARGLSERLLARALRSGRDSVTISTKVGLLKTPLALLSAARVGIPRSSWGDSLQGLQQGGAASACFDPRYVRTATERSLRRLGGRIDVLMMHGPGADVIEAAPFLPAVQRLIQRGDVRTYGISCASASDADGALALPGLGCVQVPLTPVTVAEVDRLASAAGARGVGVIGMAIYGDGSLLIGPDPGARAAQLLRSAVHRPGVTAVLVGMSTEHHVRQNLSTVSGSGPGPTLQGPHVN